MLGLCCCRSRPQARRASSACASPPTSAPSSSKCSGIARRSPSENFLGYVKQRLLHQHAVPSRHRELRDPGRRRRPGLQGQADAEADPERSRQRPQESARHRRSRARQRPALRRLPVLRQRRRQRGSRSAADALGLRGVRPGHRRHGSRRSHQRLADRRAWVRSNRTRRIAARDHPEDRAA